VAQCINSADGEVVDLTSLDDEQLGQLALRNTRPSDRDERVWRSLCAAAYRPRVRTVLLEMKARNSAAIEARRFPDLSASRCANGNQRTLAQAHRQWHSRAEKFARRVEAALAALDAEQA